MWYYVPLPTWCGHTTFHWSKPKWKKYTWRLAWNYVPLPAWCRHTVHWPTLLSINYYVKNQLCLTCPWPIPRMDLKRGTSDRTSLICTQVVNPSVIIEVIIYAAVPLINSINFLRRAPLPQFLSRQVLIHLSAIITSNGTFVFLFLSLFSPIWGGFSKMFLPSISSQPALWLSMAYTISCQQNSLWTL